MKTFRTRLVVAAVAACALTSQLEAQDIQYETVTRVDFAGAAGAAMRVAARLGGGSTETIETTYIKGRKMRSDADQTSSIIDLDAGSVTMLDHQARTYTTFTFDEMLQRARETGQQVSESRREEMGQGGTEGRMDFRFSVDRGNERQRVAGYDADRFFLTIEAEAEAVPEGGTEMEKAGTLVVLTDMWTSKDIPVVQALSAFEDVSAQRVAEASAAITEGFAAAFADDPRIEVAFQQSMEEARKIEGMAVKSVTHFVTVAPGKRFDRNLITNPKPSGPSLAQQAGRAALGGLMGRLGGRRAAEPEPAAEEEPTQVTLFTVTSEVRNVKTTSLDDSLFEIPAGYTQQRM